MNNFALLYQNILTLKHITYRKVEYLIDFKCRKNKVLEIHFQKKNAKRFSMTHFSANLKHERGNF